MADKYKHRGSVHFFEKQKKGGGIIALIVILIIIWAVSGENKEIDDTQQSASYRVESSR